MTAYTADQKPGSEPSPDERRSVPIPELFLEPQAKRPTQNSLRAAFLHGSEVRFDPVGQKMEVFVFPSVAYRAVWNSGSDRYQRSAQYKARDAHDLIRTLPLFRLAYRKYDQADSRTKTGQKHCTETRIHVRFIMFKQVQQKPRRQGERQNRHDILQLFHTFLQSRKRPPRSLAGRRFSCLFLTAAGLRGPGPCRLRCTRTWRSS